MKKLTKTFKIIEVIGYVLSAISIIGGVIYGMIAMTIGYEWWEKTNQPFSIVGIIVGFTGIVCIGLALVPEAIKYINKED